MGVKYLSSAGVLHDQEQHLLRFYDLVQFYDIRVIQQLHNPSEKNEKDFERESFGETRTLPDFSVHLAEGFFIQLRFEDNLHGDLFIMFKQEEL